MTEDMNHSHAGHGHGVEFEQEDLNTRGVFGFMVGLAVLGVIIYFLIHGMYVFLDNYEHSQMTPSSPLVTQQQAAEIMNRRVTQEYVEKKFKENGAPLLEIDERGQLHDFVMDQEKELNSYGWVDEKAGVAHIPIALAMKLTEEHGLPVLAPGGTAEPKTPVSKAPAAGAAEKK